MGDLRFHQTSRLPAEPTRHQLRPGPPRLAGRAFALQRLVTDAVRRSSRTAQYQESRAGPRTGRPANGRPRVFDPQGLPCPELPSSATRKRITLRRLRQRLGGLQARPQQLTEAVRPTEHSRRRSPPSTCRNWHDNAITCDVGVRHLVVPKSTLMARMKGKPSPRGRGEGWTRVLPRHNAYKRTGAAIGSPRYSKCPARNSRIRPFAFT
jgi:hypothetical protein